DPEVRAEEFRGRRVTIVGLGKGRTTAGLARFLVAKGAQVTIADRMPREELREGIERLGDVPATLVLGPSSDDIALADPDFVFVIPGIRPRSPTILRALNRKIPVLTEMALFFRLCPAPIVGVTGTKGKTTTAALHTGAASEVRGFSLALRPRHGAYLNDRQELVLVGGDRHVVLCAASELRVPGRHNVANALAAAVVGDVFDIDPQAIAGVLREFEGVPRRLETVGEKDGVLWVNDSAATTPAATETALAAFDRPAVVILGGISKGADFSRLARALTRRA